MPGLTLFEAVKKGALHGLEMTTPYCVLLIGVASAHAMYAIECTDNKTYQYMAIIAMYNLYQDAFRLSAVGVAGGAIKGACDYYWEENQENIRHSM